MKWSRFLVSNKTVMLTREMYRRPEADKRIRMMGQKRMKLIAAVLLISVTASIPVFVFDAAAGREPVTKLSRNDYGKGDRTVTLTAKTKEGPEETISVNVSARKYSDAELQRFSEELDRTLWTDILGENHDAENVTGDLVLPDHKDGFPFDIRWRSDKPLILDQKGVINKERLLQEDEADKGIRVMLCATLTYEDYSEDKYSYIVIKKQDPDPAGSLRTMIEESIKEDDRISREEVYQTLPENINDMKITFYRYSVNRGVVILFIGIAAAVLVIAKKDDDIRKEAAARRKQIESDHARILNQYALYHTAGMNPRAIWGQICIGYEQRLKESEQNRRYAYDEMLITKKMMDEGIGELAVYDDFAARMSSVRYRSFISLIKQSVVNGGDGLSKMLYEEMEKARRDRMAAVKVEASEAQTKLLAPMFMMLVVVLVIVCVPAFMGLAG